MVVAELPGLRDWLIPSGGEGAQALGWAEGLCTGVLAHEFRHELRDLNLTGATQLVPDDGGAGAAIMLVWCRGPQGIVFGRHPIACSIVFEAKLGGAAHGDYVYVPPSDQSANS